MSVGFPRASPEPRPTGADAIALPATVSVAEITGSESFVHRSDRRREHRFVALVGRRAAPASRARRSPSISIRRGSFSSTMPAGALAAADLARAA